MACSILIDGELSELILPFIYQQNGNQSENIRSVNSWIRVASTRWMGLTIMGRVLTECQTDAILNYAISWLSVTSQIAVMDHESEAVVRLASSNFSKILKFSSQLPDLSRTISSNHIGRIIQELLIPTSSNPYYVLKCCKAILKYFPGPCGTYRGKLLRYLLPHLLSFDSSIRDKAIRCWCYIPLCGGGGTGGKAHAAQLEKQCHEAIDALTFTSTKLFDTDLLADIVDPCGESLSLPFPPLPSKEPEISYSLIQRFVTFSKCLKSLMETEDLKVSVDLPFHRIMKLIQSCCEVTPKNLGHTSEKLLRSNYLVHIHQWCLEILKTLIKNSPQFMFKYSTVVNRICFNLLNLWKDRSPEPGLPKAHSYVRSNIYIAISEWLQSCGSRTRFLRGEVHDVKAMLDHIIDDIIPIPDKFKVSSEETATRNRGRGKQKKRNSAQLTSSFQPSRLYDQQANQYICSNALKVIRICVYSHGAQLSTYVHKSLQEAVVGVLLHLMEGKSGVVPYQRCEAARKELYHALLSLCLSPSMKWSPPVQFAVRFFSHGAARDTSMDIRGFCGEASVILSNIVHPRAPAMHRVSASFSEECLKKYNEERKKIVDPGCGELVEDDIEEPVDCEDVETSTSDLIQLDDKAISTEDFTLEDVSPPSDEHAFSCKQEEDKSFFDDEVDGSLGSSSAREEEQAILHHKRKYEDEVQETGSSSCDGASSSATKRRRSSNDVIIIAETTLASSQVLSQDIGNIDDNCQAGLPLSSMLADFVDDDPGRSSDSSV